MLVDAIWKSIHRVPNVPSPVLGKYQDTTIEYQSRIYCMSNPDTQQQVAQDERAVCIIKSQSNAALELPHVCYVIPCPAPSSPASGYCHRHRQW